MGALNVCVRNSASKVLSCAFYAVLLGRHFTEIRGISEKRLTRCGDERAL